MNDLYRIDPHSLAEIEKARKDWRVAKVRPYDVVPDDTLQQIAKAWKAYRKVYVRTPFSPETGQKYDRLFKLLDGLNDE